MGTTSMRGRFAEVITDLLDSRPDVAVVLADIGVNQFSETGAIAHHPDRVVNVGIREQLMIGVAGGLALAGMRPFVHSYTPFLVQRPFEQIKLDLGHQGVGAVLVSIGGSYDAASEGRTHQAPGDVALIDTLPGWEIHVPGHPDEVELLLRHAASHDRSVYVRLADNTNAEPMPIVPGRFHTLRNGDSATIVAVGPTLDRVVEASRGLDVTVLYAATVRPFDRAAVAAAWSANFVVVEPYLEGTSAHEVAAAMGDRPHRLLSIGVPKAEHRHYGRPADHQAAHGLDAAGLRRRIVAFIGESRACSRHSSVL